MRVLDQNLIPALAGAPNRSQDISLEQENLDIPGMAIPFAGAFCSPHSAVKSVP